MSKATAYLIDPKGQPTPSPSGSSKVPGREVSGLVLWLIDAHGKRVAHVRTEVDGYLFFEEIKPGDYTVALDTDQSAKLGIRLDSDIPLHLGARNSHARIAVRVFEQQP